VWLVLFNRLVLNSINSDDIHANDTVIFAAGIMMFLFLPLYSFFNFCIYCYPRYARIKENFPEKSRLWCMQLLYTKDEGESEMVIRRRSQLFHRGSTGNFSIAGIQSTTATEVKTVDRADSNDKSSEVNMSEQWGPSSFHGSSDEPCNILELVETEDGVANNNCHAILVNESLEEMEIGDKVYLDY
jgi:hypothetical protein